MPLKIVIIGSGIAGMASAAFLRQEADVTILERGTTARIAGGQGISIPPNAAKLLVPLGFDARRARAVRSKGMKAYSAQTGELVRTVDVDMAAKYGVDGWTLQRTDAREELHRLATTDACGGRRAPAVRYGARVVDIDPDEGTVSLEGGETLDADVIIVAAGMHTKLKERIVGSADFPAAPTGQSLFRFLVSAENAAVAAGRPHEWWDPAAAGHVCITGAEDGTNRCLTTYACRGCELVNFSCIFPSEYLKERAAESWYDERDVAEALEIFHDFPPLFKEFMKHAEELKVYECRDHDPLPTYVRGRAVLIGDAAHAMTPFQGQGAAQGIEDAEALRLLLAPGVGRAEVPAVLRRWESARRPRASLVQGYTRQAGRAIGQAGLWKNIERIWAYGGIYEELERIEGGGESDL